MSSGRVRVDWGRGRRTERQRGEGVGYLREGVGRFEGGVLGREAQNRLPGLCELAQVGSASSAAAPSPAPCLEQRPLGVLRQEGLRRASGVSLSCPLAPSMAATKVLHSEAFSPAFWLCQRHQARQASTVF